MSEKSSKDNSNSSDGEEPDIRVSAIKLRNDIKRRVHNGIEKRRKDKINYWIHKLAELLPFKEPKRESKTHLLENLYQYINQLKERNESLMFGNSNTIDAINVEEIRRLTKRCKDLEEKNINYYRLLETAGISPNGWPKDIQFERPTKYSKKITEQQLSEILGKSSDKKLDQMNGNNKRMNDFDENSGQKKKKTRNRKRKESKRDSWKDSPPTPVLPNLNSSSSSGASSAQTPSSAPIVLLNDQHMSTVSAEETPRLIVNTSDNGFNALNTIQIRPTVGSQQLQFLSTGSSIETLHSNTNLLSGQLLFNLNPPPPQPQATAVLLPNGQILPIITQRQPQQQSLIYAPNQSFLLANTSQPTLISGQTGSSIGTNLTTNTIKLIQNSNETQNPKPVMTDKPKEMTTTIETISMSPKPLKKKSSKKQKKSIIDSKLKNSKTDNNSNETEKSNNCEIDGKKLIDSKDLPSISDNKTVDKPVINTNEEKMFSSDKINDKLNESIGKTAKTRSKTKSVITDSRGASEALNSKLVSNCDILAKATQSIFSPPPRQVVPNSCLKKEVLISNNNNNNNNNKCINSQKHDSNTDNSISDNKSKKRQDSVPERTGLKSNHCVMNSNENEVISEYCANSIDIVNRATCANKANELINDTNNDKNDNYVENRNQNNSKIEKTIASGNKAEICKQSNNNQNSTNASTDSSTASAGSGSGSSPHKLSNASTPELTNTQTINSQSNAIRTEQTYEEQNITRNNTSNTNTNTTPNTNRLNFGFSSEQSQTNANPNTNVSTNESTGANQTSINDNELPTLLLSSLNDENEVSAESVQSVSNSSLPAFLSLSPEHLNEYLPKDNITHSSETEQTEHTSAQLSTETTLTTNSSVQFRLSSNVANVEQHPIVSTGISHQKEQQNYSQYSKSNESSVAAPTAQTETRSLYSSNFPTISSLINNDYSEFALNSNKSMFSTNNSNNYLENLNPNPLMNHKMNSQNNNFLQFPLQNDNSLMPSLYPMHSYPIHNYLNNNPNNDNSNTNRHFFAPNETQTTIQSNSTPKAAQNPVPNQNQSQSRQTSQTTQQPQQPQQSTQQPIKATQVPQPAARSQPQNQSNPVMPMRSQRHPSTEQLQHNNVRQEQHSRHPSQHSVSVPASTSTSNTLKTTSSSAQNSVQYSTQNSFSSYSAEALIRQNEPSIQQIQSTEQNRYSSNANTNNSRIPQQTHTSNQLHTSFSTDTNAIRSSSRASISYSAESLIQSNSMTNSTQMPNKSTQREVTNESLNNSVNTSIDNNNRISYYQHIDHNINSNANNNLMQRTDQNNSNNLFNFDHSLNSRLMATTSNPISQNCGNSYPQITFNSHLPTTTSSESVFPITSNATTVNTNSNRNLGSNTGNSITITNSSNNNNSNNTTINNNSNSNNNISSAQPPQHSPVIYPNIANNSQNSNPQQSKRSANNTFNPSVNAFIHSNVDSYANPSNSSMYSTTGSTLSDTNLNANPNHYQRSARNNDIRFTNCLQPTNQNPNTTMSQHNNPNTGCFFSNAAPNTTYFPTSSATPFPALLPSAASPFDPSTPFSGAHRPPMFPNSFMPDFNPPFVNTSANNPLPPIGSNFNLNSSVNNNSKTRETQASNARSSSNMTRSPNQSKSAKMSANSGSGNTKSSSKKQNNSKHNHNSDNSHNSSSNTSLRHLNDNYFSMNDLMSTTPQTNNRYSNNSFLPNSQTHNTSRQPVPAQGSAASTHSSNTNTNKNATSSADTTSSYTLFRPQSQNINNPSNATNSANFSVNSLHNPTTTTPSNFGSVGSSGAAHHSSHATNFHLSNIFPDINNTESLSLSPMKFPPPGPPVTPVVPPPVGPPLSQTAMDVSAGSYQNYHPSGHHQNLYHSHHSSARISTPHNAFNTFLTSGTPSTHNTNSHSFDPHITPNNRTASTPQMTGIAANASHPTHPTHHSHHTYANIVPSFNF